MTTGLLEEDLELAAGGFSDSVDLLHQLLQERADVPLEERCLIRADGRENFRASLAFLDDHLNQARHGCHSLLSDPAADVTAPVKLIIIQGVEERVHDELEQLSRNFLNSNREDHRNHRLDSLLSRLGVIGLTAFCNTIASQSPKQLLTHLMEQLP